MELMYVIIGLIAFTAIWIAVVMLLDEYKRFKYEKYFTWSLNSVYILAILYAFYFMVFKKG